MKEGKMGAKWRDDDDGEFSSVGRSGPNAVAVLVAIALMLIAGGLLVAVWWIATV